MANTFLKNFKGLISKQYACEISDSVKMKANIFKFKKEFELKEAATLSRFPKKELKNFIKIECPINTGDENLKAQEVQTSLKRLRAMHGVKESLVCQNCSKRSTCKVANMVPEDIDNQWKGGMGDVFTSLYYFSREVESNRAAAAAAAITNTTNESDDIDNDGIAPPQDLHTLKNKLQKEKAELSIEKYRECQRESSFFKSCASATKLTDTFHILLNDLYQDLGIESKRYLNEYLEEEHRRRFMERLFKKFESEITAQNTGKKSMKSNRNNDEDEDDDNEDDFSVSQHPLTKKNKRLTQSRNLSELGQPQDASATAAHEDGSSEDPFADDSADFVQVAGTPKKHGKNNREQSLFNRIIAEDAESAEEVNRAVRRERESDKQTYSKSDRQGGNYKSKNRNNSYEKDQVEGKQSYEGRNDRKPKNNKYESRDQKYDDGHSKKYERGQRKSGNNDEKYTSKYEKGDRENQPRRKEWQERNSSKFEEQGDRRKNSFAGRENNSEGRFERNQSGSKYERKGGNSRFAEKESNHSQQQQSRNFEKRGNERREKNSEEVREKKDARSGVRESNSNKDWIQPVDQSKMSRFMFKDSFEQKQSIQKESEERTQFFEEKKAKRFEKEIQDVQEIVQSSEDVLNREVDRKRSPKYAKGAFKFSKTTRKSEDQ